MAQDPIEDAMNFLIRLMDTRQKVLFACKEEDENELKYSHSLVQRLFRCAIEIGLISDTFCTRLCPYAQDLAMTDEDHIQQTQYAISDETEKKRNWDLLLLKRR